MGSFPGRPVPQGGIERRYHRTFLERHTLEQIYFWFDLYGPDGRPSHTKSMTFLGFVVALGSEVWWGFQMESIDDINGWYVTLILGTLSVAMGRGVFLRFAHHLAQARTLLTRGLNDDGRDDGDADPGDVRPGNDGDAPAGDSGADGAESGPGGASDDASPGGGTGGEAGAGGHRGEGTTP